MAWLVAVLVLGWCLPVAALPLRVQLQGVDCSSNQAFFESVRARTARVRAAEGDEHAALLQVRLERSAGSLRGELRLLLEDGSVSTRRVVGASCAAVMEALSLTAALALESAPAEPPPVEASPAEASPPLTASSAPASEPVGAASSRVEERDELAKDRDAHRARSSRWRAEVGVQAALARLVAPHLNVGGAVAGRVGLERPAPLSPTLGMALLHTDNGLFESSRHVAVRVSGAALSLCPLRWRAARLVLEPCAQLLGARLQASGRDLPDARKVTRSWWGAGALLRGAIALGPTWQLGAEAGALLPLVERRFVALPSETSLGATPAASPFASFGVFYVL